MPSYNVSKAPLEKMEIEVVYTDATRTVIAAVRLAAFGRVREDSGWLPPKDLLLQREWSELSITEKGYVEPVLRKAQKDLNLAAQLGDPEQFLDLSEVETLTAGKTDGYAAALRLDPGYTAATAQTVTRHNYIDVQNVSVAGAGPAAVTNSALFRFDAAIGAHGVLAAAFQTTDSGADTTDWAGGIIVNANGTLYKIPIIAV